MTTTDSDKEKLENELAELHREISANNRRLKELQEQLFVYESAASGANDGLWDWDFVENKTFVSRPWKTMLGIDPEQELPATAWNSLLHPEDKELATTAFENFVSGKSKDYYQEFRLRHADGSYRWILSKAMAIRDKDGKALRVSGSHTDITDRRKAADDVRKSESKYRMLFQNSLVSMLRIKFETGDIIEANDKLGEMLEEEHLSNKSFYKFFYSQDVLNQLIDKLKEEGHVENFELQLKTAKNEAIWVSFSGKFYYEENEIDGVLKDITQTKENLIELQKVNFELDSFVYHASHDLRSPLRSVLGLIDVYRLEHDIAVKDECIDKIESSVKRLDRLVMDLLSISRNDRVTEPNKEINLLLEINNSISSYYNASNTKGLEITARIDHNYKFVSDVTRVRIILNNLISNAIKYRSFTKERSLIDIDVKVNDREAVIKIEDNGEGIEHNKVPHIFDMFYRATEKSEGSGLGLYIVKKVADKLSAKIEVDSIELEGTTFTVRIPNSLNQEENVNS